MRYHKGCIALSRTRDYPLLRQVLRAGFITHSQLFEFMRLDYCETSRHAFNNRVLRLVRQSLLLKHQVRFLGRGAVYSIADLGASHLVGMGESYAGSIRGLSQEKYPAGLQHALGLNDIHLALQRSGDLVTWTAETEIRSRNELTNVRLGKNYDALVRVRVGEVESRFALVGVYGLVFLLAGPSCLFFLVKMQMPESYTTLANSDDLAQPAGLSFKLRMAEKPADETCCLVLAHRQANNAVMRMTETTTVKPKITSEERRPLHSVQERDDFHIFHAWAPDLVSNLARSNAPTAQQLPLILRNIFIEYIHLPAGTSSSLWFIRISRASRTDSAMASWLRAPRQFSAMASQAMPLAT